MSRIIKRAINTSLFSFIFSSLFATVIPVSLADRVQNAGQVVMARAIAAHSYWDANHKNIYTTYTMETRAFMKVPSSARTFELILRGGEVDTDLEIVTPNVSIEIGQEYVMMVNNASESILRPNLADAALKTPHFQLHAYVQGIMPYKNGKYVDYATEEPMDERTMMTTIQALTNMTPLTPDGAIYTPREQSVDLDRDGVCSRWDCDDNDPNYPKPIGAPCNDNNSQTLNDQIQADGCTCAGNPGLPVDCENILVTAQGGIIRIDNLLAQSEKVEMIGSETNGQSVVICDGDCDEVQYIEGLQPGHKAVQIWMYGEDSTSCYKEFIVEITEILCEDGDDDNLCDIKDCAPMDTSLPAIAGTPCNDGNPNTLRDIYLIDGCTCAGVEACPADDAIIGNRLASVSLKNGKGEANPSFMTGSIEADDDLIIEGSGFGNTTGSVEFANSDSGGRTLIGIDQTTDYVSWTDTEIRLKIPSRAGTGTIIIKNSNATTVGTANITINYSINSLYSSFRSFEAKTRQNIKFTNRNETGGYTLQLNTPSNFAFSEAVTPLENAIDTWICHSGVNWQIDKSGTTTGFGNDGNCVVLYEPNLPVGVLGITTSRYKASGSSSCSQHNTVWYIKEFDVQFLPESRLGNFGWNFSSSPPQSNQYDFETIALHELGHAHGLGHVIDEGEIMHYSVRSGVTNRDLTPNAKNGCVHKMYFAVRPNCIARHEPMTLLPAPCANEDATPRPRTAARIRLMLEGYYDPANNNLKTSLMDNNLLPAEHPFNTPPFNFDQEVTATKFPDNSVDWLLLELRDEEDMENVITTRAVLINSDGDLTDLEGNTIIIFEGLEDQSCYFAIHHKSHLPIISNTPQPLSSDPAIFDFSASADAAMGTDQQKLMDGKYFMSCGDFDGNGVINSLDFNLWRQSGAAVNSYSPADADGNGIINSLDFNLWKTNGSKISVLNRGN
ncbi:MAG: matrixin family metalloprotease [Bacteroidota bacterium]